MQSDGVYSRDFFCSFKANATGVKFCKGLPYLQPMTLVMLRRDRNNKKDTNAVEAMLTSPKVEKLGHLEKWVAQAVAHLMDVGHPDMIVKG